MKEEQQASLEEELAERAAEADGAEVEFSDESDNDWINTGALPRTGPTKPQKAPDQAPMVWALARANRKKAILPHHFLPPQITVYKDSESRMLEEPLVVSSWGKGQTRVAYTVGDQHVLKLTTDSDAHGEGRYFAGQFKEMAAQVVGLRSVRTHLRFGDGTTEELDLAGLFRKDSTCSGTGSGCGKEAFPARPKRPWATMSWGVWPQASTVGSSPGTMGPRIWGCEVWMRKSLACASSTSPPTRGCPGGLKS